MTQLILHTLMDPTLVTTIKEYVWGLPLLSFICITAIYLTVYMRGLQFRLFKRGLQEVVKGEQTKSSGDISHWQALMTSLASAIGTGNIIGIAVAVQIGGLGSIFWLVITALFGMIIKYSESLLAVLHRVKDKNGEMCGGPMYYLELGMRSPFLGTLFALLGAIATFGIGNLVQVHSIASSFEDSFGASPLVVGAITSLITLFILNRGIKSIGPLAAFFVPLMSGLYLVSCFWILLSNFTLIPYVVSQIFIQAFSPDAAIGGSVGGALLLTIQTGIARSIFSNEAGLGISSIASAAAKTDYPARQGLIAMIGTIVSSGIVCVLTGLVVGLGISAYGDTLNGYSGAILVLNIFKKSFPYGDILVTLSLTLFAYTTILGWAYYGEKCSEYLFHESFVPYYRLIFSLALIPGALLHLDVVWSLADILNAFMVVPNLLALLVLKSSIRFETERYLADTHQRSL